jgi:hypothetical protein
MILKSKYGIGDEAYYLHVNDDCEWDIIGPAKIYGVLMSVYNNNLDNNSYSTNSSVLYYFQRKDKLPHDALQEEVFATLAEAEAYKASMSAK